jgi:hypothetical protein
LGKVLQPATTDFNCVGEFVQLDIGSLPSSDWCEFPHRAQARSASSWRHYVSPSL